MSVGVVLLSEEQLVPEHLMSEQSDRILEHPGVEYFRCDCSAETPTLADKNPATGQEHGRQEITLLNSYPDELIQPFL